MENKKKNNQIQYAENPLGSIATINQANGVSENKIKKIEHKRIDEGGLSRLYGHIKDQNTFAVIGSQDKDTGEDRSDKLLNLVGDLSRKGKVKGYNWLLGKYVYDDGRLGEENSLIVYNITKEDALEIGKKLNQETILWKDPNFFGYIYVDTQEVPEWNKGGFKGLMSFDKDKIKDIGGSSQLVKKGWSLNKDKLKSKSAPFVYECFLVEPAMKTGYVSEYLIDSYNGVDNSTNNSYNNIRGDIMSRIKENINPYLKEDTTIAIPKGIEVKKERGTKTEKPKLPKAKIQGNANSVMINKSKSTTPYYIDENGFKVFIPRVEDGCVILTRDMMDETDLEDWEEDW